MRARGLLMGVMVAASAAPVWAKGPSFDCVKASSPVEKVICSDAELSALDAEMEPIFRAALSQPGAPREQLLAGQRSWLRDRGKVCTVNGKPQLNAGCLKWQYSARLIDLRGQTVGRYGTAPSDGLTCYRARISHGTLGWRESSDYLVGLWRQEEGKPDTAVAGFVVSPKAGVPSVAVK